MKLSLAIALAALACSRPSKPPPPGPEVQVMGDSHKQRRGEESPASSPFFDGARVSLRAVRGETLGVQVLLSRIGVNDVALSIDAPGVIVHGFEVHHVEVTKPSTRMYGPSRGKGWYPDRLTAAGGAVTTSEVAFFDVEVAATAAPGAYTGELSVGVRRFPVALTVEPLAIDLHAAPLVWVWYAPRELARIHQVAKDSDELIAWERRYAALFRSHGAYASTDLGRVGFEGRDAWVSDVAYVPVFIAREGPEAIQKDVRHWIEVFRDKPGVPFSIPIDEPGSDDERRRVRQLAEWARAAGSGGDRFLFGVTDKPRPIYGDAVDLFVSPYGIPAGAWAREREPAPRLWTYNGNPPYAGNMIIDNHGAELRTWGWIAERYGVPLWFAWEGMYFSDRYGSKKVADVTVDPLTFDDGDDHGNGDGLLAYPGAHPSLRLKALRRGLQDRLLVRWLRACGAGERADAIVREAIPRALAEGKGSRAWSTDEADWERARQRLIDAALAACG